MSAAPLYPFAARGLVGLGLGRAEGFGARRGGDPTVIRPRHIASHGARGGPGRRTAGTEWAGWGQPVPRRRASVSAHLGPYTILVWELYTFYTAFYVS